MPIMPVMAPDTQRQATMRLNMNIMRMKYLMGEPLQAECITTHQHITAILVEVAIQRLYTDGPIIRLAAEVETHAPNADTIILDL